MKKSIIWVLCIALIAAAAFAAMTRMSDAKYRDTKIDEIDIIRTDYGNGTVVLSTVSADEVSDDVVLQLLVQEVKELRAELCSYDARFCRK